VVGVGVGVERASGALSELPREGSKRRQRFEADKPCAAPPMGGRRRSQESVAFESMWVQTDKPESKPEILDDAGFYVDDGNV
jgi:hypothetical protein